MNIASEQGQTTPWGIFLIFININLLLIWSFAAGFFPLNDFVTNPSGKTFDLVK